MGHLVFTRRKGKRIVIGDEIEIIVEGITTRIISLNFSCPPGMAVHEQTAFEQARNGTNFQAYLEAVHARPETQLGKASRTAIENDCFYIGDDGEIRVLVSSARRSKVKFVIDAPEPLTVDRGEVYDEKRKERSASSDYAI